MITAPPPKIEGLDYIERLGCGGYADVFLYRQRMPDRPVAVKVLRDAALSPCVVACFTAEANAMARLEHPNIVPVYAAGVADDGRPFLTMSYCPPPNLGEWAALRPFGVAEVLRVGIQIGAAVETAHRAGLLHRDIKPANILLSQYGTPALADFGIAGRVAGVERDADDVGISVPWSAPEVVFATAPASVASDVYSLAATLWTLLIGRSPFEIVGGDNAPDALARRIRSIEPGVTGRPDIPLALDVLLLRCLAKDPAKRPASALEMVRVLQGIERGLGAGVTPAVLPDEGVGAVVPVEGAREEAPSAAKIARVAEQAPPARTSAAQPVRPARPAQPTKSADPTQPADPANPTKPAQAAQPVWLDRLGFGWTILLGSVVLLASVVGIGVLLTTSRSPTWSRASATTTAGPDLSMSVRRSGASVTYAWSYPGQRADHTFNVLIGATVVETRTPALTVNVEPGVQQCIRVQVLDSGRRPVGDYGKQVCAP